MSVERVGNVIEMGEGTYDRMMKGVNGSYTSTDWAIKDRNYQFVEDIKVGRYIVIENYYTQLILYVNDDRTLTECKKIYE